LVGEEEEVEGEVKLGGFEVLAEWRIRMLREPSPEERETYRQRVQAWALSSLGVEEEGQRIYGLLIQKRSATSTEVAEKLNIAPATARKYLDQLHMLGLVEYIGREYHLLDDSISLAITRSVLPRIREVLDRVASVWEISSTGIPIAAPAAVWREIMPGSNAVRFHNFDLEEGQKVWIRYVLPTGVHHTVPIHFHVYIRNDKHPNGDLVGFIFKEGLLTSHEGTDLGPAKDETPAIDLTPFACPGPNSLKVVCTHPTAPRWSRRFEWGEGWWESGWGWPRGRCAPVNSYGGKWFMALVEKKAEEETCGSNG